MTIYPLLLPLLLICQVFPLASAATAAPKLGIVDFEIQANYQPSWNNNIGKLAADMLMDELTKERAFEIYERRQLANPPVKQGLDQPGALGMEAAIEIGRLKNLDFIVIGAIREFSVSTATGGGAVQFYKKGYSASVDVRIVDVQSGRMIFSDIVGVNKSSNHVQIFGFGGGEKREQKNGTEVLRIAIKKVAKKIHSMKLSDMVSRATNGNLRHTPKQAVLVADVEGTSVTLTQGLQAGLQVGQTLTVRRQTGVIKHPASGHVIKAQFKQVGKLQIVAVTSTYSTGQLVLNRGVKVGDQVALHVQ